MTYSPDIDMMRDWVVDAFPNGKWKDGDKLEWLCKVRNDEKTPSCYINVEKRTYCDFGGNSGKLSELCEQQGIPDPYRKGGSLPPRRPEPTINKNAMIASGRWKKAQQAEDSFPYLLRKGVPSHGLRTDIDNTMGRVLLVPALDASGQIVGLERISAEGQKQHLGDKKNTFFLIGEPRPGEVVYVAEGYATGASLHQITGSPVAISFSAFNLGNVGHILEEKGFNPIICTDSGASLVPGFRNIQTPDGTPDKQDWNDLHQKYGLDKARRMFKEQEALSTEVEAPTMRRRRIIRYNELQFKEPDFLIDDILESGALVSVYGATGSYKTYFVLDMLLCVAKGIPFHNRAVKQAPAIYVCAEGQSGIKSRIMAWCLGKGYDAEEDIPDFYYFGDPISLPEEENEMISFIDEAIGQYKTSAPGIVAFDTLARTFTGDENSNTDMGAYIRAMDKIKAKYPGITVMLVHHTGHGDQTRGRGASALKCALDVEIGVTRTDNTATITNTKMKNAECFKDIYFNAVKETVGYNQKKDKPITDLYLVETEMDMSAKGKKKLSATDQIGIDSYHEALKEVIRIKVEDGNISNIHEGVHLDEWRTFYYKRSTAETQGAKETAFRRARKKLVSYGILEVDSDFYKLSGDKHNQTASAYFLACKGELTRQADTTRQVPDMSGDIIPDRHRHTPIGVSDVGHVGVDNDEVIPSNGEPDCQSYINNEVHEEALNKEYSEQEAREWLKTNPEAKRMYQQKRDRMMQTIKDKQLCIRTALLRTWEHYHPKK
ncbi:MAG: AAA family ATPase [Synergistaceae bacterium]